ncbi:LysR family transcriptional regulator [Qingshengfaniella alkalisoli]|uniref:LysR family transcriptional regulator n=1 Tax=Qingshengfaniella alkalisoli TaxID=2599296 RepID=A0A5B8IBN0_9RHOB|nr:LysR family transcriptional regulator [Qingshengfaniella alkalisoli]QDY71659.1 LysR family transcriptional regulator [Qingshengfaniella alkalisoli]
MPYLDSIRVFVRVVELGSITAGGRDLRLTPAVASNRIKELESRLGVRLFNRTTRNLSPTEAGSVYYDFARKVIDALEESEAVISGFSDSPHGVLRVSAPLGVGRRIIAPLVPQFNEKYPDIEIRLRLTDRRVDLLEDSLDVVFFLGTPKDSNFKLRKIADCPRVLCAAPAYLDKHGIPQTPEALISDNHSCLLLRYPRSPEYFWMLQTPHGLQKFDVSGKYDADDGDVLTNWALEGWGIANKVQFDIQPYLDSGSLVPVLTNTPPEPTSFGCLFPHRKLQDPKVRLFIDFMVDRCRKAVAD